VINLANRIELALGTIDHIGALTHGRHVIKDYDKTRKIEIIDTHKGDLITIETPAKKVHRVSEGAHIHVHDLTTGELLSRFSVKSIREGFHIFKAR
jgi:hypothetical protein